MMPGKKNEKITVYVIGKHPDRPGEVDIVDIIERTPTIGMLMMVSYKGQRYPVMGSRRNARIFVGL